MIKIEEIFSGFREEWGTDDFQGQFVEPPYYGEFTDSRPMFLVGGRGTGKTIALRSLHFTNPAGPKHHGLLGIYVRAFKNRVRAFTAHHVPVDVQVRWSWFLGQSEGEVKVYSD